MIDELQMMIEKKNPNFHILNFDLLIYILGFQRETESQQTWRNAQRERQKNWESGKNRKRKARGEEISPSTQHRGSQDPEVSVQF